MESIPVVTIITITYQAAYVLKDTMNSVFNQDTSNYEYLLIDGGSTDGTIDIIKTFEPLFMKKSISLRWISEPDKGLYDAMNKGLRMACGEYIWFMNAGDTIATPHTLSGILDCIKSAEEDLSAQQTGEKWLPDFIYGETMIITENGKVRGPRRLKVPAELTWKSFRMGMLVCHQSMLVKRCIAPEFNLNYRYSADFDWAIRCLRSSSIIVNTNLVLSHFLEGGVTNKKMMASLKERFRIMSENYGWCSTVLLHDWFFLRAIWFRLIHGWI